MVEIERLRSPGVGPDEHKPFGFMQLDREIKPVSSNLKKTRANAALLEAKNELLVEVSKRHCAWGDTQEAFRFMSLCVCVCILFSVAAKSPVSSERTCWGCSVSCKNKKAFTVRWEACDREWKRWKEIETRAGLVDFEEGAVGQKRRGVGRSSEFILTG